MTEVIKFEPVEVGETYRETPETILDTARSEMRETGVHSMLVVWQDEDGEIRILADGNSGVALILLERAKQQLVFGE